MKWRTHPWLYPIIWIIPLIILVWGYVVWSFAIPFYDIFPDPEYPYLINGMNVAIGNYSNIGHADHPGSPFQMYCGFVIKVTHLITGEGTIASDVLGMRPEFYLKAIQGSLVLVSALIAYLIGLCARRRKIKVLGIIVLQSAIVLLPWLFMRVSIERWLMVCSMLFTMVYIAYGYKDRRPLKFAIWSGVVMAMAVTTKFNYLPILLLPFLLTDTVKNKLVYIGTTAVAYFIFILPILDIFHYHINFITGIASHDGKYGTGEERMFNTAIMKENLITIFTENPEIAILLVALAVTLVGQILKNKSKWFSRSFLVPSGIVLIVFAQLLMVTKHYAPNYLVPLISIYPLVIFILYTSDEMTLGNRLLSHTFRLAGVLFIILGIAKVKDWNGYQYLIDKSKNLRTELNEAIPSDAAWIATQPLWMRAPYVESGLCYAVSYCFDPGRYLVNLSKQNPNVFVLNSSATILERWRVEPTSIQDLLEIGKPLHLYATKDHNAQYNIDFLQRIAEPENVELKLDTVYSSGDWEEHVLAVSLEKTDSL